MATQPPDLAKRQASRHQRELLTCKHFNGVFAGGMKANKCRAGVAYREHVGGDDFGWIVALPCLPREVDKEYAREVVPCALREFPAEAEVAAEEEQADKAIKFIDDAITLCRENAGGKRGVSGSVPCPACGSSLQYSISAYNGHIHGRCATPDCLSWMQ